MLKSKKGLTLIELLAIITSVGILTLIVLKFFGGYFADEDIARRALENQGFSNIKITDKQWFAVGFRGCDGGDSVMFAAEATNFLGKNVDVIVCSGWLFKGATVRTR